MDFSIVTIRGIYNKSEPVAFRLGGKDFHPGKISAGIRIFHLDREIFREDFPETGEQISLNIPFSSLTDEMNGFGCRCDFYSDAQLLGSASTAFDFENRGKPVIRYGFLSDFGPGEGDNIQSLDFLAEFHMSHVQFYDWIYRPHHYEGSSAVYKDTMGKEIDGNAVGRKIEGCRERRMKTLGYGAVYAAGAEYLSEHPEQALRDSGGTPYNLIDRFFIMNMGKECGWRENILMQYRFALEKAGFDGIHMDTYGFPKRAFIEINGRKKLKFLEEDFPELIEATRETLGNDAVLIFNNVGNWPVSATGPAPQNGVYIEVWDPYDRYSHIRRIILDAAAFGKPVILAAYLAPFRTEENHGGDRALNSALILHSAIVSLGASHLLLGESGCALTQGYYSDYSRLRTDERRQLKLYYDFQVRYRDIFYDETLSEISETHTAGENREFFFSGAPVSADGRAGSLWIIVRENRKRKVLSLINLTSQTESEWNRGKNHVRPVESFTLQVPVDGEIVKAFIASPDQEEGSAHPAEFEEIRNERGPAYELTLENLPLWTLIVIEYTE